MSDPEDLVAFLPALLAALLKCRGTEQADLHAQQDLCEAVARLLEHRLIADGTLPPDCWLDGFLPRLVDTGHHHAQLLGMVFVMRGAKLLGLQPLDARLEQPPDGPLAYILHFGSADGPFPLDASVIDLGLPAGRAQSPWIQTLTGSSRQ